MLEKKVLNVWYALNGIKIAWREEFSFKVQVGAMIIALALGLLLRISQTEWLMVMLSIGLVLSAESFNTALEELCDKFKSDPDPHIGKIKDLAAGAVLIASLAALIIGITIFLPHIAGFV